jgi:hypothetical protein
MLTASFGRITAERPAVLSYAKQPADHLFLNNGDMPPSNTDRLISTVLTCDRFPPMLC